jgi:hypothetical protein
LYSPKDSLRKKLTHRTGGFFCFLTILESTEEGADFFFGDEGFVGGGGAELDEELAAVIVLHFLDGGDIDQALAVQAEELPFIQQVLDPVQGIVERILLPVETHHNRRLILDEEKCDVVGGDNGILAVLVNEEAFFAIGR